MTSLPYVYRSVGRRIMMMMECQVMQISDEWWEFSRLATSLGIDISRVRLWCNSIYRMKCDTLNGNEQNSRMTLFFSMIRNKNKSYVRNKQSSRSILLYHRRCSSMIDVQLSIDMINKLIYYSSYSCVAFRLRLRLVLIDDNLLSAIARLSFIFRLQGIISTFLFRSSHW